MASKTVLSEVEGFTPLIDMLVEQYSGVLTAAVFGRVWRYCQGSYGDCKASLQTIADELGLSYATVLRKVKVLCTDGYLKDKTPNLHNRPHTYADTGKVTLQVLLRAGLAESKTTLAESKGHSCTKQDEDTTETQQKKEERENKDIEFFESFERHPASAFREENPEAIADPSKKSSAVEEVARQLAPAIDWVWGSSDSSDKKLLHAAEELLKQCEGDVDGTLDALDVYLGNPKNRKWAKEDAQDPHWLLKSVAGQYQKFQGQASRQAASRVASAAYAERSQVALAERRAAETEEQTEDWHWWERVLGDLLLQMTGPTFDHWLSGTTAERDGNQATVYVNSKQAKDWLDNRLRPVIERTVAADGVTDVVFEIAATEQVA